MRYMVARNANNAFGDLFNDFFGDWGVTCKIPSVDVHEDEKQFTLEAELPGYKEEDVKISVQKHVLTLSSEKESSKNEDKKYLLRERCYRSFQRKFTLPESIDEENISASFKNGILTINLPKLPVAQPRKIEVKIED